MKNPARFRSEVFDQTALVELFKRNRVPVLELPTITATTIQAIQDASAEKKKHLTYADLGRKVSARLQNQAGRLNGIIFWVVLVRKSFRFACKETPRKQRMFVFFDGKCP